MGSFVFMAVYIMPVVLKRVALTVDGKDMGIVRQVSFEQELIEVFTGTKFTQKVPNGPAEVHIETEDNPGYSNPSFLAVCKVYGNVTKRRVEIQNL